MANFFDDKYVFIEKKVSLNYNQYRIDSFLADLYPQISRKQWQSRIALHLVSLNDKHIKHSKRIKVNDIVKFQFEKREEPTVNSNYEIVYQDDFCIIVNKPSDLPIHPSGIYFENTLVTLLKRDLGLDFLAAVNRIDRETTGLVLFATNPTYFSKFQIALKTSHKFYLVAVHGDYKMALSQKGFIGNDTRSRVHKKQKFTLMTKNKLVPTEYEKTSHTLFRNILKDHNYSLLMAKLKTGRTHQIRATLCSLGFPVVGDKIYGRDESIFIRFINGKLLAKDWEVLKIRHTALHAYSLSFFHPYFEKQIKIKAKLPSSLSGLFWK